MCCIRLNVSFTILAGTMSAAKETIEISDVSVKEESSSSDAGKADDSTPAAAVVPDNATATGDSRSIDISPRARCANDDEYWGRWGPTPPSDGSDRVVHVSHANETPLTHITASDLSDCFCVCGWIEELHLGHYVMRTCSHAVI